MKHLQSQVKSLVQVQNPYLASWCRVFTSQWPQLTLTVVVLVTADFNSKWCWIAIQLHQYTFTGKGRKHSLSPGSSDPKRHNGMSITLNNNYSSYVCILCSYTIINFHSVIRHFGMKTSVLCDFWLKPAVRNTTLDPASRCVCQPKCGMWQSRAKSSTSIGLMQCKRRRNRTQVYSSIVWRYDATRRNARSDVVL